MADDQLLSLPDSEWAETTQAWDCLSFLTYRKAEFSRSIVYNSVNRKFNQKPPEKSFPIPLLILLNARPLALLKSTSLNVQQQMFFTWQVNGWSGSDPAFGLILAF